RARDPGRRAVGATPRRRLAPPGLPPLVDLFARGEPYAFLSPQVVVDRLEVFDPVRHTVDVRVHRDRHHTRVAGSLGIETIELIAAALYPCGRFVVLDHHRRDVVQLERVRHGHQWAVRGADLVWLVVVDPVRDILDAGL